MNKTPLNYVIVDLEATCWEYSSSLKNMEIIEIGAVLLEGKKFNPLSDFEQFIKPSINPELSDFCIELTHIQQNRIDEAPPYKEAYCSFLEWIGQDPFKLCSWGKFDYDMFIHENTRADLVFPSNFMGHINLKELYASAFNTKPSIGLMEALHKRNLTFQGRHHRGIDDARNIAIIAQQILILDY